MGHVVVFSDSHVGDRHCSLRKEEAQNKFINDLKQYPVIEELILLGDIFEINLAPLNKALDGTPGYFEPEPKKKENEKDHNYLGMRSFLKKLDGLPIKKIVYLPGNHDYHFLQLLNSIAHDQEPMDEGKDIKPDPRFRVSCDRSFLNGLFPPSLQDKFTVEYPEHLVTTSTGEKIVLTHGHHLDKTQTLLQNIEDAFKEASQDDPSEMKKHILQYESRINAYQGIAYSQSKNYELRNFIDKTYNRLNRLIKLPGKLWRWWQQRAHHKSGLRRKPISKDLMMRVKIFLQFISEHKDKKIAAFVFGHTHDPDLKWDSERKLLVANCGSFLVEWKRPRGFGDDEFVGTYVVIDKDSENLTIDERIKVRLLTLNTAKDIHSKAIGIKTVGA